jgi:hypothetical protein
MKNSNLADVFKNQVYSENTIWVHFFDAFTAFIFRLMCKTLCYDL